MAKVLINKDRCKACGFCVSFCPEQVLAMSGDLGIRGVHYARLLDENSCTGCAICGLVCPDVAIEVYR